MKTLGLCLAAVAVCGVTRADFMNYVSVAPPNEIPDADPNGYASVINVPAIPESIVDVDVFLNIEGGWNGDFYAYLNHGSQTAILVNRPGVGAANPDGYVHSGFGPQSGFHFTLSDEAAIDVHWYGLGAPVFNANNQLTGTYQPDGRFLDPFLAAPGDYDGAARSSMLNLFDGTLPEGQWTLFVADAAGGNIGNLVGWGLHITTVPEPSVGAWISGLGLLGGIGYWVARRRAHRQAA